MYQKFFLFINLVFFGGNCLANGNYRLLDQYSYDDFMYDSKTSTNDAPSANSDRSNTDSWKRPVGTTIIVVGSILGGLFALYSIGLTSDYGTLQGFAIGGLVIGSSVTGGIMLRNSGSPDETNEIVRKKPRHDPVSLTSEKNRLNKDVSVVAGLGFRTPFAMSDRGLTASSFLSESSLLSVYYSRLEGSEVGVSIRSATTELSGNAVGASYKIFLSNSFYIDSGIEYLRVKGSLVRDYAFVGDEPGIDEPLGSYQNYSAFAQVGNQWQWRYFTLGVGWLGVYLPLSVSKDFKDIPLGLESVGSRAFKKSASAVGGSFLKFYLGWSF